MPPKKDSKSEKGQLKALEREKAKIAEDKTFGLKNKNKSKQVQKYIKGIQQSIKGQTHISPQVLLEKENQKKEEKKKKSQQEALLASLFKGTLNVAKLDASETRKTNPKSIKEDQIIDIYVDHRDKKKDDTMETWDQNKLEEVIRTKHGHSSAGKPTDIVCKYFLEAVEKKQYGWFWTCPNGGDNCKYRHCLPPGYVLKQKQCQQVVQDEPDISLEELLDKQRTALPLCEEKLTLETFLLWKEKRKKLKQDQLMRERQAEAKRSGVSNAVTALSGRDLFAFNPSLFVDDAEAAVEDDYQEDQEYWNSIIEENKKQVDIANEEAILKEKTQSIVGCNEPRISDRNLVDTTVTLMDPIKISQPSLFLNEPIPENFD